MSWDREAGLRAGLSGAARRVEVETGLAVSGDGLKAILREMATFDSAGVTRK